ncbi:hypothetical protein ACRN9C_14785 [Shewanella frigidimarina]|uniref:hypothetical protein n=1 Tax=Shewanella frigidimarina TaxID=56812 RepID=UPI003D791CD7
MNNSYELTAAMDADEGLKSKRKLLTVVSLILLALSFSGASIDEANTFIFKIKFANQNGLGILLVLSIIFLMIRYYNYAKTYHDKLYSLWTNRLLDNPFFFSQNPYESEDASGLIVLSRNSEIDARVREDDFYSSCSYKCKWLFCRYLVHEWGSKQDYEDRVESVNVFTEFGVIAYVKTLFFETIEQSKSFFTHRENLDVLAPYILGCLAIASYYFNAELIELLLFLTPHKK